MQGSKKEVKVKDLYVGFAEERVIAVCPDNETLRDVMGYDIADDEPDPVYIGEKEGVLTARVDVWLETMGTESYRHKRSFFLEDRDVATSVKDNMSDEEKDSFVPKYQFVNQTGDSFYSDSEENLPDYFTKFQRNKSKTDKTKIILGEKKVRIAKVGEAELYQFVKHWLSGFDYWNVSTNILLDTDGLFNGDFSQLQEQVGGEFEDKFVHALGVKVQEKEGEVKEYQDVHRTTLPGYSLKMIRNANFTPEKIAELRAAKYDKNKNPDGRYLKDWEQIALDITDSQYPWKSFTILAPMKKYDSEENFASSESVIEHTAESADY